MPRRVTAVVLPALVSEARQEIGGTAAFVVALESRLRRRGLDVCLLGYGPGTGEGFQSVLPTLHPRGRDLTWALWKRRRGWRFSPETVVHAQRPDQALSFTRGPWPLVVSLHGCQRRTVNLRQGAFLGWAYTRLERQALRRADALVFETHGDRRAHLGRQRELASKAHLVPLGVDRDVFRPGPQDEARRALGLPTGIPAVVYLGRFEAEKNTIALIRAVERVPGVELWLAGRGQREEAWRQEAGPRVRFLGFLPAEKIPILLRAGDILALASHHEGLATVVLQAWASGRPVVVPPVGDFPAIMERDGGVVARDNSPEALAEAMQQIFASLPPTPEGGRALEEAMRAKSAAYDWDVVTEQILDVYEAALNRRTGKA